MTQRRLVLQGLAACSLAASPLVRAQAAWPSRPVKFMVAFPPGGPADIIARLLGEQLQAALGQSIVVENRGGAAGSLASAVVAKAEPDGYTVLVNTSSYAVNPALHRTSQSFDAERDLTMVSLVASSPNLIVGSKKLPANTLNEAMAAARVGKFSYSSAGAGTTPHLSAEYLFKVLGKLDVTHVPFGGAGPAAAAVLGSQVELGSVALPAAVEFVKTGGMKAYAVTSLKRVPSLPDVPTVAESGFPDFTDVTWVALFVPAKTPSAIAERLNREIAAVQKQPVFIAKMAANGFDMMGGTLPELKTFLHGDLQKWAKVVKDVGAVTD